MGGGNNAGMRVGTGRYFLLLNSDAWSVGDAVERLVAFADAPRRTRPSSARGSRIPTARSSARCAASRRSGGSRPSTSSCASSRPRTRAPEPPLRGRVRPRARVEADWVLGACLLVRREATEAVGLLRRGRSSCSARRPTGATGSARPAGRSGSAPEAEVVHVGGASHGGSALSGRTCAGTCASSPSTAAARGRARAAAPARGAAPARASSSAASAGRTYREAARWLAVGARSRRS